VGGWLRKHSGSLGAQIQRIQQAVDGLGFSTDGPAVTEQVPTHDARFDALIELIEKLLLQDGEFQCDERLIVFTEYKTTLDYIANRLRSKYQQDRVLTLFGAGSQTGMGDTERESVKAAFNDPEAEVRILVATDAASEGLNLHQTARYLLHYDCPWNPSRLEQRNGRLDRYGQARDVTVHHFDSSGDHDIHFLNHVIRKADEIREDLGSANEVFDRAFRRRLIEGGDSDVVRNELEVAADNARASRADWIDQSVSAGEGTVGPSDSVRNFAEAIDLNGVSMAGILESAMAIDGSGPQLDQTSEPELYRIRRPDLPQWKSVIDRSVRQPSVGRTDALSPIRQIAFGSAPFIRRLGPIDVFQTRPDAVLMHLAHPMIKRALGVLNRRRYPGPGGVSRWTVQLGRVPAEAEALILLSVEELGVNELRESIHHWVRTIALAVRNGQLDHELADLSSYEFGTCCAATDSVTWDRAREIFDDTYPDLRRCLREHQDALTERLRGQLQIDEVAAREQEDQRYRQREGEVSQLIAMATADRLEREIGDLKSEREQGYLFDEAGRLEKLDASIREKQDEINRRRSHYNEIRDQLRQDRNRILNLLLPKRFALASGASVFPVTVEIRLPAPETPAGTPDQ